MLTEIMILAMAGVMATVDWSYDIVRESGKFCPERDSCNFGRKARDSIDINWKSRNCYCDNVCQTFGDCCVDAKSFDPETQQNNFGKFECQELKQYGHINMRSECQAGKNWAPKSVFKIDLNAQEFGSIMKYFKTFTKKIKGVKFLICNFFFLSLKSAKSFNAKSEIQILNEL